MSSDSLEITDAVIKAGRKYLFGFGVDDFDDDEIAGLYRAMQSAHPQPDGAERTPYCPNCGEGCLDAWHRGSQPDGDVVALGPLNNVIGITANIAARYDTFNAGVKIDYSAEDATFDEMACKLITDLQARLERYRETLEVVKQRFDWGGHTGEQEGCPTCDLFNMISKALGDTPKEK